MKFRYYSLSDDMFYNLIPTFSEGNGIFGNNTVVIDNLEFADSIARNNEYKFNILNNNLDRNEFSYNIYRDDELLIENYVNNYYLDADLVESGNYCYNISLIDNNENEMLNSQNQCVEVNLNGSLNLGDINGDNLINVVDVIALVTIILNDFEYNILSDINSDNVVNIVDVIRLIDIILNP